MDGDTSDPVSCFFLRNGLAPAATRAQCLAFARARYGDVQEISPQGYCSYTLLADRTTVVQFRPESHRIDVGLAGLACDAYAHLAPETRFLGVVSTVPAGRTGSEGELFAYSMDRMPGVSLAEIRSTGPALRPAQRERLVEDFAHFLCVGWKTFREPVTAGLRGLVRTRVGRSLRWRLEMMREGLPQRFRPVVRDVLVHLHEIEALPWVLTHGDVVPGNIMIEAPSEDNSPGLVAGRLPSGALRGLLDWAEAEFLPFGVGISSAEELFGETSRAWDSVGPYPPQGSRFEYYPEADDLRRLLWRGLQAEIPELAGGAVRETVEYARIMGILLWHGIAFDDGRLDRVVQEGRDDEEIQRLDLFLFGTSEPGAVSEASQDSGERETLELAQSESVRELCPEDRAENQGAFPRDIRLSNTVLGKL